MKWSVTTRFIQRNDGYTDHNKTIPIELEFSGDDVVCIFIDGYLVGDVGGAHDAAGVIIDFVKGEAIVNKVYGASGNVTVKFADIFPESFLESYLDDDTGTTIFYVVSSILVVGSILQRSV